MSTIKDFENAPIGATATDLDGSRTVKMGDGEWGWVTPDCHYYDDEEMVYWGYTLEPPAPTTAREALDLAWDLAHEVKEGQVIPGGSRFLESYDTGMREYTALWDVEIDPERAPITRTLEPLPDPEPDWLNAPAVIASTSMCPDRGVWVPVSGGVWTCCRNEVHWYELCDVVPLYPPNEGTESGTTAPKGYTPSNSMGFKNEGMDA